MSKTNTPIKATSVPSAYDTPMTTLEYLRKVENQNAQVLARQDEIEEALNGKVAKKGDTMTGNLSVPNINVADSATIGNANVEKLTSSKLNQKYEGAIKAEIHADENGIVEFINAGNEGRFDTTRVIKPSEVKTEIYDNQQGKRMSFRLPYFEASAGEHRLLTEEDLGGGGTPLLEDIKDSEGRKRFAIYNGTTALTSAQIDNSYIKAAINGHSLDIVFYVHKVSGFKISSGTVLCEFQLPSWIADKIISSAAGYVIRTSWSQFGDGSVPSSAGGSVWVKKLNNTLSLVTVYADDEPTMPNFRVEAHLFID